MKKIQTIIPHILGLVCFLMYMPCIFAFQKKDAQGRGVEIILETAKKKSDFNARNPIRYKISLKNNYTNDQEGTLVYMINNKEGETILTNSLDVKVNARKKIEAVFEVPLDQEGEYTLVANIEMTDHSETISRSFSYSGPPRKPKDRVKIPNPYDQNWSRANVDNEEVSTKESLIPETDKAIAEEEPVGATEEEGEMIVKLKPNNRDGIYYDGKKIKYNVTITNKYKTKQEGTFKIIVTTDDGKPVGEKVVDISIRKKSIKKFTITMPEIVSPGVYDFQAALNVTTYDDTTHYAFGFKINEINTPYHKPPDFDEFWRGTRDELAKIDPQYKITLDEGRSTYFHTVYKVEIQSLGNIPFYGWLSVPKPKGKYPVLVGFGGYKIELNPLYFDDFISFTINVRGIDKKIREQINPENREQLLVNIEDKNEYIYRGIYMDCIRAIEFVFAHGEQFGMDLKRVIAFGGSQGASLALIIAAMMPTKINTVVSNNPIFFDWVKSVEIGKVQKELSFPVKDMLEFEAKNPEITMDNIVKTLQYFEVQNFIPNVVCPVLYAVSLLDNFAPASTALAAFNKMPLETLRKSELYVFPNLGHEVPKSHDAFVGIWFLEKVVHPRKR